ncbi:MAG: YlmC/YmxH family sporulation protein [Clostridia bacterium]|nr:YlmC/YmxH family sporulation protein [Clostridia bacterium]
MEQCKICQLQTKDVVNICDGRRLGYIRDVIIDVCSGCVKAVVVLCECRPFPLGKGEELVIPWENICCFGKDTVLVKLDVSCYGNGKGEKKFEKN